MNSIYEQEVVSKLRQLERSGIGKIFELGDSRYGPILGFKRGKNPKLLMTSCHHANEVYNTYHTLLYYAEKGRKDCVIVPVVDVERFCINMSELKKLKKGFDSFSFNYFVWNFLKNVEAPGGLKAKEWKYGREYAEKEIISLEGIIQKSKHVIDFHNWPGDSFGFISNYYDKKAYEKVKGLFAGSKFKLDESEIGGLSLKCLDKALFMSLTESTITTYAAARNVKNLGVEVPVVKPTKKGFVMLKKEDVIKFNVKIIEAFTK